MLARNACCGSARESRNPRPPSDILYVKALAAPFTVNTLPESTLKALADHGKLGEIMSADGGDCEVVLEQFAKAGIDADALAARLQDEGAGGSLLPGTNRWA